MADFSSRGRRTTQNGRSRRQRNGGSAPAKRSTIKEQVYERTTYDVSTTGVGVISMQWNGSPTGTVLAARLAGYSAIRDEYRFDRVKYTFRPIFKGTVSGRVVAYLERTPAQGPVATVDLAQDQLEKATGSLDSVVSLSWTPQQPSDRAFASLAAGAIYKLTMVGDSLSSSAVAVPNATVIYSLTVEVWFTLRGRP
jgi:hypothetical protein